MTESERNQHDTLEGNWSSRWNGGADPTIPGDAEDKWKQGRAELRTADDRVYVYDTRTNKLLGRVQTGKCPNWITFSPDGRYCCVSNSGSDDCSIINVRRRKEAARVKVGKAPKRLLALAR